MKKKLVDPLPDAPTAAWEPPSEWEPPSDVELPEGDLEPVASDELDAMLAERALEAMLSAEEDAAAPAPLDDEDTEIDAGPRDEDDEHTVVDSDDDEED